MQVNLVDQYNRCDTIENTTHKNASSWSWSSSSSSPPSQSLTTLRPSITQNAQRLREMKTLFGLKKKVKSEEDMKYKQVKSEEEMKYESEKRAQMPE